MKRLITLTLVFAITATMLVLAQAPRSIEAQFKAAQHAEEVEGDLRQAIEQYRQIAQTGDRTVAVRALIRLAECHQKLGDAESRKIYERIVREYTDQKEAVVLARARLAPDAAVPVVRGDRPVWSGPKADTSDSGQVSPDGRFITYVDRDLNLTVHDVVANTDRPLTSTGPAVGFSQEAGFSTISRDGKQVAYAWLNDKSLYDLRIVPLQAATLSQPRVFFSGNHDFRDIFPRDWSPDGKFIAVSIRRKDATGQIGLAAVTDGSLRVLKSIDWRGANKILFSPDGRWVAYDLPVGESDEVRSLYVMAVDGSVEHAVVTHPSRNALMAWTHDGRNILFASNRSGQTALWAQRIAGGKSAGGPAMIKRDIGSYVSLGLTNSGSLFVFKGPSANYVQVANMDFSERRILPSQSGTFQQFIGSGGSPSWSPDGKLLLFGVCRPQAVCAIAVASPDSGDVREVRPKMAYLGATRWSADGQSFITDGTDLRGKRALYRINARTGVISFLHERPGAVVQLAPDEKKIYYRVGGSIIERDIVVGTERELFHERAKGNSISIKVSPDGRHIAAVETAGTAQTLYLLSVSGNAPTELLRAKSGEELNGFRLEWTPDGRSVILPKVPSPESPTELWLVPIDSQSARKLDFNVDGLQPGFAIHPNGRQIAFVAATGRQDDAEVWALENFLVAAGAISR